MQHVVVGVGATGIVLMSALSKYTPRVIQRTKISAPYQVANAHSITTLTPGADFIPITKPYNLSTQVTTYWICVKSYDLREALSEIKDIYCDNSLIVLCQNGFDIIDDAKNVIGSKYNLMRALLYFGAHKINNLVKQYGNVKIHLASEPHCSISSETLIADLNHVGIKAYHTNDITSAEWQKGVVNIIINSLCTLARQPNKTLLENISLQSRARKMLAEIILVARCYGCDIKNYHWDNITEGLKSFGDNRNSTLVDLENNRNTELDITLGRFIKKAQACSLQIPECLSVWEELQELLKNA